MPPYLLFFYSNMSGETIKLIEEKIEELYNSLMDRPLRVLSIFNDFFGEDKVDMQGYWSLDKFKSWMNIEPLSTYIPNGESNSKMNTFYRTLSWYSAAGWNATGW